MKHDGKQDDKATDEKQKLSAGNGGEDRQQDQEERA
jgi:hypothetical protein